MKIAIVIPDRGDRPELLANCLRMMKVQTLQPDRIYLANWEPHSDECDITERYRKSYELLSSEGYDCILFIENDDWYSQFYISRMVRLWEKHGKPEIFGTNYTYYYHIGLKRFEKLTHYRRASAMNTLITPNLTIDWGKDNYPYTDIVLWSQLKGVVVDPIKVLSIGIKHNVGKTGGHYHNNRFERYRFDDFEFSFLKRHLDVESFNFYKNLHEKIQSNFR